MKSRKFIVVLAGGMLFVAIAAHLGCRDGFPALISTLNLPSVLLLWSLQLPLWVYPLLYVALFFLWSYPYSREAQKPKRSLYLGACLGLLSLTYYVYGFGYAIAYQGTGYFWGVSVVGSILFTAALCTSLLAVRRGTRNLQVISDALLFSWFAWLSFPYMGELP